MGNATFRYHKTKAPTGTIFDSDDLPSEKDGWFDSPKKVATMVIEEGGVPAPVLVGDLPDPRPFISIKAYASVVQGLMPKIPTREQAAARLISDDDLENMEREGVSRRKAAIIYYARLKYGADLPSDRSIALLMADCMELDERAEQTGAPEEPKKTSRR